MTSTAPSPSPAEISWPDGDFRPIAVADVDLADGLASLPQPVEPVRESLVLVRLHGQPLGLVRLYRDALNLETSRRRSRWCSAVTANLGPAINRHLLSDGIEPFDLWTGEPKSGVHAGPAAPLLSCHGVARPPFPGLPRASVVISTRERPVQLKQCLDSLMRLSYPNFEVLVVDNDPTTEDSRNVVSLFADRSVPVRYFCERRRGLGVSHNRVLAEASGEFLAFTDDDVVVDRDWLLALAAPFLDDPSVAAVTGLILPAELDTPAQVLLEAHGSFSKGFSPAVYDLDRHRPPDPLFPFTVARLGSGANMAFDTAYLRTVGGFDPALGTGSPAKGGDDLAGLFGVLASGRRVAYQPSALVWHHHHRDEAALERQAYGYGVGYGAFLTSALLGRPGALWWLLPRVPGGIALALGRAAGAAQRAGVSAMLFPGGAPAGLSMLQCRGMLKGPLAYRASRRALRTTPAFQP